jgi:DNA-binding protein HU-beta
MNRGFDKVNREEFLRRVEARLTASGSVNKMSNGTPMFTVEDVYHAMLAELIELIQSGQRVSLTGFGSFYTQMHKGHPVQFGGKKDVVPAYRVFKFSASNVLNKRLREAGE